MNSQNVRVERHLTFFCSTLTQRHCAELLGRFLNGEGSDEDGNEVNTSHWTLADGFKALSLAADNSFVHLFSTWLPSEALRERIDRDDYYLIHHPLAEIPVEDLDMNRRYHRWMGTKRQAKTFRAALWAPAWKKRLS